MLPHILNPIFFHKDEQKEGVKLAEGKKKNVKTDSSSSDMSDKLLKEVDMNG